MLKSTYNSLDEIAEADRPHYKKIGGRYVLELDGEHPVQVQNTTLAEEKKEEVRKLSQRAADAEAKVTTLETAARNQPTLPSGHVAVPADEAKLLEAVKELGEGADTKAKVENIKTKITEAATLATENANLKKTEQLRQVADSGINGKKLKVSVLQTLDGQAGGLTYEERDISVTENGKPTTQKAWHVKDGNKWVPLSEYSETHWKDFGPALIAEESASGGTKVPGQTADDKGATKPNLYSDIRKQAEERAKKKKEESVPLEKRLNLVA